MRLRLLVPCAALVVATLLVPAAAWADGQQPVGSASASVLAGTINAGAAYQPPSFAAPVIPSFAPADGTSAGSGTSTVIPALPVPPSELQGIVCGAGHLGACIGSMLPPGNPPATAPKPTAAAPVSPALLARRALASTRLPGPAVQMWPPGGAEYVNFAVWVHVADWRPASATASAGPVTATVTATPWQLVMHAPDSTDGGATYQPRAVTCAGPGPVWGSGTPGSASSPCSFTWTWPSAGYEAAGTYPFQITVVYRVAWRATGAAGGGPLGAVTATTTIPVHVGEIEALGT